jgi:hypothetical protein
MDDNAKDNDPVPTPIEPEENSIDENMHLFIYGNLMIRDVDTGEILVNQRV